MKLTSNGDKAAIQAFGFLRLPCKEIVFRVASTRNPKMEKENGTTWLAQTQLRACYINKSSTRTENPANDTTQQTLAGTQGETEKINLDQIKIADAKTILERPQVPILCYHQVRNWKPTDGKVGKDYIVEIQNFKDQIKMLADSGYHTILPDQPCGGPLSIGFAHPTVCDHTPERAFSKVTWV